MRADGPRFARAFLEMRTEAVDALYHLEVTRTRCLASSFVGRQQSCVPGTTPIALMKKKEKTMKYGSLITALAIIILALAALPASAQLVFLEAVDSGFYTWEGSHSAGSTNYLAGDTAAAGVNEIRNFFVFDLSGVSGTVVFAALQIYNPSETVDPGNGFNSPDPFETYVVNEVTTDIGTLTAGGTGLISIFDDLGDGTVFGSTDIDSGDNGTSVLVPLSQDAVDAVNSAVGGSWAVGGAVTTLVGNPLQTVFAYSNGGMQQRLILDLGGTVFWDDFETGNAERWSATSP